MLLAEMLYEGVKTCMIPDRNCSFAISTAPNKFYICLHAVWMSGVGMQCPLSCFCNTAPHYVYNCDEWSWKMHADLRFSTEIVGFVWHPVHLPSITTNIAATQLNSQSCTWAALNSTTFYYNRSNHWTHPANLAVRVEQGRLESLGIPKCWMCALGAPEGSTPGLDTV